MINGSQNPIAGKDEIYTLTDYSLGLAYLDTNPKYTWCIKRLYRKEWIDITKKPQKTGLSVPFNFGPQVVGEKFLLEVYKETKNIFTQKNETHKMGELQIIPASGKVPKITKVVLFNRGAKDVNKASYTDKLVARAYCVGMFNKTINFHLWEDDAPGGGHNAEINKNNRINKAYPARVNGNGIAETEISLSADQNVMKQVANRLMMRGDTSEGAFHEFYVTASYDGKILNANQTNVDVADPDYKKQQPKPSTPQQPKPNTPQRANTPAPPQQENLLAKSINFIIENVMKPLTIEKTKTATYVGKSQPQKKSEGKCPNCEKEITLDEFNRIFPNVHKLFTLGKNSFGSVKIQQFLDSLNKTLIEFNIDTCMKKAFFLAQITKETGEFSRVDENLYYTSEKALHSYWDKATHPELYSNPNKFFRNEEKLGNYVYRNLAENGSESSGDGYKFRGRGLIQITRKKGYRRFGEYSTNNLVSNPDLLLSNLDLMVRSSGWYWKHGVLLKDNSEKDINTVANTGDFTETTRLVHGSTRDIVDRTRILDRIKPVLETDKCQNSSSNPEIQTNSTADIEYHIMTSNGEIHYKIHNEKREVAEYFYHDISGNIHNIGKYTLRKIKNVYGDKYKDRIKGNDVYLVDIRNLKNYSKGAVKFKLSINTNRYYMNDVTLAALLGGMLDGSFEDFTFNGFSNEKGQSIGGSKSHKNGMNGDLRYLRKDKSGGRVYLNESSESGEPCGWKGMDEIRQNQFNNALYKYGWKSMLSWRYNNKTLNHAIHYEDHHDHLHIQSFTPKLKKIK